MASVIIVCLAMFEARSDLRLLALRQQACVKLLQGLVVTAQGGKAAAGIALVATAGRGRAANSRSRLLT
jgi:hypothetical protein